MKRRLCILLLLGVCTAVVMAEGTIVLRALPATVRAWPTGPLEGKQTAEIAAAKGEVESFQVVITASGGNLERINAEISPLRNEKKEEIPA